MAVPDWPLSFGSLNPPGWWHIEAVRLEHGHRLFASLVGLLVTILTAWVWKKPWALVTSSVASAMATFVAMKSGVAPIVTMHVSIWSFAGVFFASLFAGRPSEVTNSLARRLSGVAFVAICLQATLGGLRVTKISTELAMVHGCVAQAFLCVLIALAVVLSQRWKNAQSAPSGGSSIPLLAYTCVAAVYLQLIVGAAVRHMKAGLAIPDFPLGFGHLVPPMINEYVAIHFAHRVGALVVSVLILTLIVIILIRRKELVLPALGLGGLVAFQIALGAHVIWLARAPVTTTLHVVNGAAILGMTLVIALRAKRLLGVLPEHAEAGEVKP